MLGLFNKSVVDKNAVANFVKKLSMVGVVQFYEFGSYKMTGKYCGFDTVNYVFIPVNGEYFVPIWVIPLMLNENSDGFNKCVKELHKRFIKYYMEYDALSKPFNVRVLGANNFKTLPLAIYTMNFLFPVRIDVTGVGMNRGVLNTEYSELMGYLMMAYSEFSNKRGEIINSIDYVTQLTIVFLYLSRVDRRVSARHINPLVNSVKKFFLTNKNFYFYWKDVIISIKQLIKAISQNNNTEFLVVFETGKGVFATHFKVQNPSKNGSNTPEKLWLLTRGGTTGDSPFGLFNFVPGVNGYKLQFFLLDKLHNVNVSVPLPLKIKEVTASWNNVEEFLKEPDLFDEVVTFGLGDEYVLRRINLKSIQNRDIKKSAVMSLVKECVDVKINGCQSVVILPRFDNPARAKSTRFVAYELFGKEPYTYYAFDNVYYLALDYGVLLKMKDCKFTRITGVKIASLRKKYEFDDELYNDVSVWFRFEKDYERIEQTKDPVMYSFLYLLDYKFNIHDFITILWYNLVMRGEDKPDSYYSSVFSVSYGKPVLINQNAILPNKNG